MVPDGWGVVRLGEIAETVTSGSRDWAQYYSNSGSKFIRMTNLRRDGIHLKLDDLKYVEVRSDSSDGKRTSLQFGDILVSITAELGKIGWIPKEFGEAYINQHIALVRLTKSKVNSRFVAYLLSSKHMNYVINSLNDAGAKAGLNLSTIRGLPIALPLLSEQKKIAKILSTWDRAIGVAEKQISNSQQQKKSLMQQLLTGKKRIAGFREEWRDVDLKDVAKIGKGKALSSKNLISGEYPVVAGGKSSPYKHNAFTHKNIITVSASGAYAGFVAFHPYELWASDCSVIEKKEGEDLKFIYQFLKLNQMKIYSFQSGGAQPHIYPKDLDVIKLKSPSFNEQQKIASVLSAADKEIETLQQKLNFLKQEKKALMQQLLTGKRRVKVDEGEQPEKKAIHA